MNQKTCTKCKLEQPFDNFPKNVECLDGKSSWCKGCFKIAIADWTKRNKDKVRIISKRCRENNKEKFSKRFKDWYYKNWQKNQDRKKKYRASEEGKRVEKAYYKEYKEKNSEVIKEKATARYKKKYKEDPSGYKLRAVKRKHKRKDMDFFWTKQDSKFLLEKFDYKCFKCKTEEKLSTDHFIPLHKNGLLVMDNAVVLCRSCNSKKSIKDPGDFFSEEELIQLFDLGVSGVVRS